MNFIDNFIENKGLLFDGLDFVQRKNCIEIQVPYSKKILKLSEKEINRLWKRKLPAGIPNFYYHEHYGFTYDNYIEVLIVDSEMNLDMNVKYLDLKFKINDSLIEVSKVSSLFTLLLEPFYSHIYYIADRGLSEYYYSLKIYNSNPSEHRSLITKSLYYLNAHYLKQYKISVAIENIDVEGYLKVENEDIISEEIQIFRKKITKRKDFNNIEPLLLYNDASGQSLENRFLGFYRVLEFFFTRALEKELKILRHDKLKTEKEIIVKIQSKDERSMLNNLLNSILTSSEKNKLISYLKYKGILKDNSFDKFSNKLYEFRNSLVHSKETQLEKMYIPDPFRLNTEIKHWNYITKHLAEICINRLNVL